MGQWQEPGKVLPPRAGVSNFPTKRSLAFAAAFALTAVALRARNRKSNTLGWGPVAETRTSAEHARAQTHAPDNHPQFDWKCGLVSNFEGMTG